MRTAGSTAAPGVVVVAYRADQHLDRCLAELGCGDRVVVVDNDANEATRAIARRHGADYVAAPGNVGFAAAVNLGLRSVGDRDVLLLNPDARLRADDVAALQRALRAPGHHRAAVGPRLVGDDGAEQLAAWPVPSPLQVWFDALGASRLWRGRVFVVGAALLLHADAVAQLGGLDERYFLYAEEADWQLRALRAGWTVAVVDEVVAVHAGGASSADASVREGHFHRSGRTFARRWYGPAGAVLMRSGSLVGAARRSAVGADRDHNRRMLHRQLRAAVAPGRTSVVHAVRSTGFAGVERLIATAATELHARGLRVTVVGGDAARMRAALPAGVLLLPGASTAQVARSLRSLGRVDVVHAHMTAAESAAVMSRPVNRARIVATRHFAAARGSSPLARALGALVARSIDAQIAISRFVADAVEGAAAVVPNGVPAALRPVAERDRTVVVLQRLEREKSTDVAIRAWRAAGLAGEGWRLVIHGEGALAGQLRASADRVEGIEFAGFADDPRAVLARAGMLLATAPAEPFGLSVVEAMAEGCPVVAADGGAHREVLGADGSYFAPGSADGAAAALRTMAHSGDRAALGARLQRRHADRFSVRGHVDRLLEVYRSTAPPSVALLSLEPWDDVWRRNQHLASRVVASGAVRSLIFVEPPRGGWAFRARRTHPQTGIEVVTPPLWVPRRLGGYRSLAGWLRRTVRAVDVVWANDPVAGRAVLALGRPLVYDVTDDWRELAQPAADRARIVAAEDELARRATTVVCSTELAARWRERYRVDAAVVGNGVDLEALRTATPVVPTGTGPHIVYVGTVHPNRVDVGLLRELAAAPGTLHLVGPATLDPQLVAELTGAGVEMVGPVPRVAVPSWLLAADVLVCPHLVDGFTGSLDAIKAYEYLATGAPVVATASSGFAGLTVPGLSVVRREAFTAAVRAAVGTGPFRRPDPPDWAERAERFAELLRSAKDR